MKFLISRSNSILFDPFSVDVSLLFLALPEPTAATTMLTNTTKQHDTCRMRQWLELTLKILSIQESLWLWWKTQGKNKQTKITFAS
jgi:hypothetical protein